MNNDADDKNKIQTLMDLVSKMKELQGSGLEAPGSDESDSDEGSPHGVGLEIHEAHVEPLDHDDVEKLEEATHTDLDNDNEEGESPEHKMAVLGPDHGDEDMEDKDEDQDEDHMGPMNVPPALLQLLIEHLSQKK